MFDQNQINEYRAVKAPAHLKRRIEHSLIRSRLQPKGWMAVAACLVVVVCAAMLSLQMLAPRKITMTYMDQEIGAAKLAVAGGTAKAAEFGAKTIVPAGIPLNVQAERNTKVSVSGGTLHLFDREGQLLSVGTDLTVDTTAQLRWDVSDLPSGCYTLTLGEKTYEISIDAANGAMFIYKK